MKRNLSVERLYSLGNFINIKITNQIEGIPDEIANDPSKIQLLFKSMEAECDLAYQEYKTLNEEVKAGTEDGKSVKEMLQEQHDLIAQELAKGE